MTKTHQDTCIHCCKTSVSCFKKISTAKVSLSLSIRNFFSFDLFVATADIFNMRLLMTAAKIFPLHL